MIFKENVNGTETVSQSLISNIVNTSSTYGTVTLLAAPTFPSGGYTTNATVFKWQREWFDITNSLTSQRDATTRITLRVTDGSQGANIWIDDIKAAAISFKSNFTQFKHFKHSLKICPVPGNSKHYRYRRFAICIIN